MRVVYKTKDERMQITFEAQGIEAVVTCLAQIQAILENVVCGACGGNAILDRRVTQGYVFYAAKCTSADCGAKLEFGQRKEESGGGLYAKTWDSKAEQAIEHNGWTWYRKEEHTQPQQQVAPVQPMAQPVAATPANQDVDDSEIPF